MAKATATYDYWQAADGLWYFSLTGRNGEPQTFGGQGYRSARDCLRGIASAQAGSAAAVPRQVQASPAQMAAKRRKRRRAKPAAK